MIWRKFSAKSVASVHNVRITIENLPKNKDFQNSDSLIKTIAYNWQCLWSHQNYEFQCSSCNTLARMNHQTSDIFNFSKKYKFLLNATCYIFASRRQMGDFGRQTPWNYENSENLLQLLFLQHAWSELEVLDFLKRKLFWE